MKKMGVFFLMLFIVAGGMTLYGQEKKSRKQRKKERAEQTEIKIRQLIEAQKYKFTALQGPYLVVTKDRIETTFLPQYSKDNSIVTYSVDAIYKEFEYKVENAAKGGWNIYIKIELNPLGDWVEMWLNVRLDGSADLEGGFYTITGLKRYPIGGRGYIEGPKRNGTFYL